MSIDTIINKSRPAEILLVEDNRGDVILAKKAFGKAKISNHIAVASNGVQALAMLRREGAYENAVTPDIILLDLNLPKKLQMEADILEWGMVWSISFKRF